MVQRKEVNKLGIQVESSKNHAAFDTRSTALKPCHQHQDGKSQRGGEMKKKMKKSRSFKVLDMESFRPQLRLDQSQLKEHPITNASSIHSSQKTTSLGVKTSGSSPNYMKPTSSSAARKESSNLQVSPPSQTSDKNKSPRNLNRSKPSSASGVKPMKVLKRNSSLKPVRPSMKKSYGVSLYHPKLNASRATCSSTLKDSNGHAFVDIHPEGTELEGTSVMKVCPYTCCSLNGHLHTASPSLKRFLSATRRLLKTQKSMKLKALSPPQQKNSGKRKKEIDIGQMELDGDPETSQSESTSSAITLVLEEVYTDFFVEIFAKPRENADLANYSVVKTPDREPKFNSSETPEVLGEESSNGDDEIPPTGSSESAKTNMEDYYGVIKSRLNNNLGHDNATFTAETNISMKFPTDTESDQEVEVWDTDNLAKEMEADQVKICYEQYKETETETNREKDMDQDKSDSNESDKDSEDEVAPDFDDGIDYSAFSEDGSFSLTSHLQGNKDPPKRTIKNHDQFKKFNPQPPRFLFPEPDPEAEKAGLKHQMMDERKNTEEWMIDYALQQAVMKLEPARKRRVTLLVEAFETVMPLPKCEAHLRHGAGSLTHARPIQACN